MRGAAIRYTALGDLLRQGRERKHLTLEQAAVMIGITNGSHLSLCELGRRNFPPERLARALKLYEIAPSDALRIVMQDFESGMQDFLTKESR